MVVTAKTEAGVEENYAVVEREPVRIGSYCSVDLPSDSTGGGGSEVAGLATADSTGGDSSEVAGLAFGGVGAPTTGAGPGASGGGSPLWAAVALAMTGVVALAVGARQTRRRER